MSTTSDSSPALDTVALPDMRFAVVATLWNRHITLALRDGADEAFMQSGLPTGRVDHYDVPGAVELTYAAARLAAKGEYDAIIVLGCVIRGGTPHFDYVCQSVTEGITRLNAEGETPVIFGVLTVDTEQDALDRAGGRLGNKGAEAALTAICMAQFRRDV